MSKVETVFHHEWLLQLVLANADVYGATRLFKICLPTQYAPELDLFSLNMQAAHSSKTKEQKIIWTANQMQQ